MAKTQHGRELDGAEMAEMLDEFTNGVDKAEMDRFAEKLVLGTHRTIQQKIMRLFVLCIEKWATAPHDLRNEATVKLCQKIVAATGDKYDRILPFI